MVGVRRIQSDANRGADCNCPRQGRRRNVILETYWLVPAVVANIESASGARGPALLRVGIERFKDLEESNDVGFCILLELWIGFQSGIPKVIGMLCQMNRHQILG